MNLGGKKVLGPRGFHFLPPSFPAMHLAHSCSELTGQSPAPPPPPTSQIMDLLKKLKVHGLITHHTHLFAYMSLFMNPELIF